MEYHSATHYPMWMKIKLPASTNSFNISPWAEQPAVFQERFVWPPRSYTCSFCRREFRSAQALGGHMNVHRRDRARLKQSSPPQHADQTETFHHHQKQTVISLSSYQQTVRSSARETSWNSRQSPRVHPTIPPEQFMNSEEILSEENGRRRSGKPGLRDDECDDDDEDFIQTKLSMGMDFADRGDFICKRHKKSSTSISSPLTFLHHSELCSSDRCSTSSSMEEIDLELRLGNSPAVK